MFKKLLFIALMGLTQWSYSQTVLVGWISTNTSTQTFPYGAYSIAGSVTSASQSYGNGVTTVNSTRTSFNLPASNTTVNPLSSPFVSFSLELNKNVKFDRFVFPALASWNNTIGLQLRWSVDDYATSLGEFKTNADGNWTLTSVDLSSKSLVTAGTVTFRLYTYGIATQITFGSNGSTGSSYTSPDNTPTSYVTTAFRTATIWYTPDATTDLNDVATDKVSVYPNPATDVINVDTKNEVTISNVLGRVVYQGLASNNKIDISSLAKGLYVLSVKGESAKNATKFTKY